MDWDTIGKGLRPPMTPQLGPGTKPPVADLGEPGPSDIEGISLLDYRVLHISVSNVTDYITDISLRSLHNVSVNTSNHFSAFIYSST